jgi:hypothetical protein
MAEAASISYGNEFSSEPRKGPLNKHIPASSKVRKTHLPGRGLIIDDGFQSMRAHVLLTGSAPQLPA